MKQKEILEINLEVERTTTELNKKRIENQNLLNTQLEQELQYKKKDLTNFALDIARKNEFTEKTITILKSIPADKEDQVRTKIQELIAFSTHQKFVNQELYELQENIDKVNHEFVQLILQKYPTLTQSDLQLCSLFRIGLSVKDISSIKSISPKSVQMSRYRLRKKLGLLSEQDLNSFLIEIA